MLPGSWRHLSLSCMVDGYLLCDHLLATNHGTLQILPWRCLRDINGKPARWCEDAQAPKWSNSFKGRAHWSQCRVCFRANHSRLYHFSKHHRHRGQDGENGDNHRGGQRPDCLAVHHRRDGSALVDHHLHGQPCLVLLRVPLSQKEHVARHDCLSMLQGHHVPLHVDAGLRSTVNFHSPQNVFHSLSLSLSEHNTSSLQKKQSIFR